MISFDSMNSNNAVKYVIYALVALFVVWVLYKLYVYFFPNGINWGSQPSNASFFSLGRGPSITGQGEAAGDDVNDSDFDYIRGTSVNWEGTAADPSNSVQKYKKTVDATGRSYWEPVPMQTTGDYLTNDEFNNIVDRHIISNLTPDLRHATLPKYIRNADNFWGTYKPTNDTLDKCLDEQDVPHEGGIFGNVTNFGVAN